MTQSVESVIMTNLLFNEPYSRNVFPYLKPEYFAQNDIRTIYEEYHSYVGKYGSIPTKEALILEIEVRPNLSETEFKEICVSVNDISKQGAEKLPDVAWMMDTTEKYCKDRAIYIAITQSIGIIDTAPENKNALPQILADALAVSFNDRVGHDFLEDADDRWEFYHNVEQRIPFNMKWWDDVTHGGFPKKTLNILMSAPNCGKSMVMCHMAANYLTMGKNVIYITLEMAAERISERIDANLMDIELNDLIGLPKASFMKKIERIKANTVGKLIVEEYPTACGHAGHFKALIRELKIKKQFTPDILIIDYINICASNRSKSFDNTYGLMKSIAEELRGLAVEEEIVILTATQTNRGAFGASDICMADVAESAGVPATADFMAGIIVTDELSQMDQIMFTQVKNRYGDVTKNVKHIMGVSRPKMKLYELDQATVVTNNASTQKSPTQDTPPWETKKKGGAFDGFEL
ncbi:MAG: DnaB-like helicase C-terminal domain-containing protein [Ghiorsea sp.]